MTEKNKQQLKSKDKKKIHTYTHTMQTRKIMIKERFSNKKKL